MGYGVYTIGSGTSPCVTEAIYTHSHLYKEGRDRLFVETDHSLFDISVRIFYLSLTNEMITAKINCAHRHYIFHEL